MKHAFYIFLILSYAGFCQEPIATSLINKTNLKAETFVGIDNFGTIFYINNNVFNKKQANKSLTYSNVQLGKITYANTFNPLKINLFYKNFNTVVILDNRLGEIFKIDFNSIQPYKNVSQITTGFDNTLWIFNQDTQQLELFDYKAKKTRAKTLPVKSNVLHIASNYNYCWLLTKTYLYKYNYFGSLIFKTANNGFSELAEHNENIILKKDNKLFYLKKNTKTLTPIKTPNLLIKQFFVTGETLYIYANETLQEFQLKIN
ncbi:hypothetical protein [Gelatiniphilus marinus]|uniref:Uncharacterized protein n=2 Tax=Gelatiniphilus marinus TaxID=1759464 RepID=A0ABW5JW64_9FLAO